VLAACGGRSAEELAVMNKVRVLTAMRDSLKSDLQARTLVDRMSRNQAVVMTLAMAPEELQAAYQGALPVRFDAHALNDYVEGAVLVERVEEARVEGRTLRMTLSGRGQGIRFNVDPPAEYKRMARELVDGLHAGLTLRVQGELALAPGNPTRLMFHGQCESAQLRRNAKDEYHRLIKRGVNERLLDVPFPLEVPRIRVGAREWTLQGILPSQGRVVALFTP